MGFSQQPSPEGADMKEIQDLTAALAANLEIVQAVSRRVELLEQAQEETKAQQIAVMTMLRALYECSPQRDQAAQTAERLAAQLQAQPGYILHSNPKAFQMMKMQLDSMTRRQPD
jgi:hypothetical protein